MSSIKGHFWSLDVHQDLHPVPTKEEEMRGLPASHMETGLRMVKVTLGLPDRTFAVIECPIDMVTYYSKGVNHEGVYNL